MSSAWEIAIANLTSVPALAFVLALVAARLGSDLRLPDPVYSTLSVFLLLGIGIKGGHALQDVHFGQFAAPAALTIGLGVAIPAVAFVLLRLLTNLTSEDRGAIAAHYGSTSLVTFSAAVTLLESSRIAFEGYVTALLALMEITGIVIGIFLGSRSHQEAISWGETLRETLGGKTVMLLLGGLCIGLTTTAGGYDKVAPFFIGLQAGVLTLFLLHLGAAAGWNLKDSAGVGLRLAGFAALFPLAVGALGTFLSHMIGMSTGGAAIMGVLCASASYIAAPASVSIGLPRANVSLALSLSLGITFPMNLLIGIPVYIDIATYLAS